MRYVWIGVAAALVGVVAAARSDTTLDWTSTNGAMPVYTAALARLDGALLRLDDALSRGDSAAVRRAFRGARVAYKRVELFTEYYAPSQVRELNGVPMPKAEDEDPETPLPPVGLQMVESLVFPAVDDARRGEGRQLVSYMRATVRTLARRGADSLAGDAYLFDAMRQELSRVSTLGIAGFDATLSGDAIVESAEAIAGVRDALGPFRETLRDRDPAMLATLDAELTGAVRYLKATPDPARFDRLAFLTRHAIPVAHALAAAQRSLGIGPPARPRAWSAQAASIYDRDAVDAGFYAATDAPRPTRAIVALGRELFFEPALSGDGTRSCASCHVPERAFTDGRPRAALLAGHGGVRPARNTPTLLNAALQPAQFADGRVRTLEDQATDVLGNASEMGGSLSRASARVAALPRYASRFDAAFRGGATPQRVRLAIAAYVRSLTALDAPFDRAVRGDSAAMTPEARRGFELFMGRAGCGTCHFAPLFGGAMPPALVENEPEVIGVPARLGQGRPVIDPDSGRFLVRRIDQHLHAFKTPTLRNVALTAPYMHNGAFPTLESVIDFYDAGGGAGLGVTLPHQTLPSDSLHLTRADKRALIAFLHALTDTTGTTARP